ncbi:MAG TPA: hypothetical protein VN715_23130 [Roseiarcus sp.]|nr:hypothetical protein [Roseiarcus sp.]
MADPVEDTLLTAFLDGELSANEVEAVAGRLSNEPALRARLEVLQAGEVVLRSAFAVALGQARRDNMAAKMAHTTKKAAIAMNWRRAAALAAIAFVAGLGASRVLTPHSREAENWRQSVAEYMTLYTPATFAPRDEASLRSELAVLSNSVGVDLSAPNLRLGSLTPRSGVLLQFQGAPLAQIGYVVDGAPTAFCVIRDGEPDAPQARARLGAFNVVSWAKAGRGFMLVSTAAPERLDGLARSLRDQVAVN